MIRLWRLCLNAIIVNSTVLKKLAVGRAAAKFHIHTISQAVNKIYWWDWHNFLLNLKKFFMQIEILTLRSFCDLFKISEVVVVLMTFNWIEERIDKKQTVLVEVFEKKSKTLKMWPWYFNNYVEHWKAINYGFEYTWV